MPGGLLFSGSKSVPFSDIGFDSCVYFADSENPATSPAFLKMTLNAMGYGTILV
jgi:hypothetical protein